MATRSTIETDIRLEKKIIAAHAALGNKLNGSLDSVRTLRLNGFDAFVKLGFPEVKAEAWKYTPVRKWLDHTLDLVHKDVDETDADESGKVPEWLKRSDGFLAVSVNGVFQAHLSRLPDADSGVIVSSLADAIKKHAGVIEAHLGSHDRHESDVFTALNTAFINSGLFVLIPEGTALEKTLYITDVLTGDHAAFRQPRNLIVAEGAASGRIVEWYGESEAASGIENAVMEICVGPAATLNHCHVFDRGPRASLINALYVYQHKDSYISTNHISFTGSLIRHTLNFLPDAEGCETHLNGLVVAHDDMHVDVHSFVDHAKPNSVSNELYKYILDDDAVGVFNGKVMVRQDAQLTNAYQSNRSVLLSDRAHMYSKPELEIYADDVKCSHGATTGQLDDEAIFYLRSRGLTEKDARLMLLEAFAAEVIQTITIEPLREKLMVRLRALLNRPAS